MCVLDGTCDNTLLMQASQQVLDFNFNIVSVFQECKGTKCKRRNQRVKEKP
jgi:hypothetical protein